jgi:hypothetical protein
MVDPSECGGRWLRAADPSPLRHLVRQMLDVRRRLDRLDPPLTRPAGRPRLRLLAWRGRVRF